MRQPVFFLSHGGGPWPWMPETQESYAMLTAALRAIPAALPRLPDAILMVSPSRAEDRTFIDALKPLVGKIDVATMREANLRASTGSSPAEVARWLSDRSAKP